MICYNRRLLSSRIINFNEELRLLKCHDMKIGRPRIRSIIKQIYIPKLEAQFSAPFLYNDGKRKFSNTFGDNDVLIGVKDGQMCLMDSNG